MAIAEVLHTLAVIDDDPIAADATSVKLEDAGFRPVVLPGGFANVEELVTSVREQADGAVCDHRLTFAGYASFEGAEAVAGLVSSGVPAILVTKFAMDFELSIRAFRDRFPVVMERSELGDAEAVRTAFQVCLEELQGQVSSERRLWRTLVNVENVTDESGEAVADVIVPAWNPEVAVRFPLRIVPEPIRSGLQPGVSLMSMVNVGAKKREDLVFKDFEVVPDPVDDDGLA